MDDRKIALVDIDAFFASVEERDDPSLIGKPVAVGSTDRRGVVATANYEARKYGVGSAMPSYRAKELCPNIIFVKPNREAYIKASNDIRKIFESYTNLVELVSIDEAYLDLTNNLKGFTNDMEMLKSLKDDIKREVGITASIGFSYNKFLAKTASDMEKPDGLTIIDRNNVDGVLAHLPISRFRGIGKKTTPRLEAMGIITGGHLRDLSMEEIRDIFGDKRSSWFYNIARGIDHRPISTEARIRKSIGISQTYQRNVVDDREAYTCIYLLSMELMRRLDMYKLYGRTITLKIRYDDFSLHTRSKSGVVPIINHKHITDICIKLLRNNPLKRPVRLFGITSSNLDSKELTV